MKNRLFFLLIVTYMLFLTGCWDVVELEDRAFVLGIALDKAEKEEDIVVTYQIALPSQMFGENPGGGEKVKNISTVAPNIIRANRQILTRIDKVLNIEHLQVILIGEELARDGFYKHIDLFFRDTNVRRKTNVLITEGKAADYFEITPLTALSASQYISDIMRLNESRVHQVSSAVDILKLAISIREGRDYFITKVSKAEKDVVVSGAAVFKSNKMIGWLDADEAGKAKWLINDLTAATIILQDVNGIQGQVVFEVQNSRTRIKPVVRGEQVEFDVNIRTEGIVVERENVNFNVSEKADFIHELEESIEAKIRRDCMEIFEAAQKKYETDFLNLGHLVQLYNVRWWEKNEKQWERIFKDAKLNLNVDAYIRGVGLTE